MKKAIISLAFLFVLHSHAAVFNFPKINVASLVNALNTSYRKTEIINQTTYYFYPTH